MSINEKERNKRRDLIFAQTYEERCPVCGCFGAGDTEWLKCPQCQENFIDILTLEINKEANI